MSSGFVYTALMLTYVPLTTSKLQSYSLPSVPYFLRTRQILTDGNVSPFRSPCRGSHVSSQPSQSPSFLTSLEKIRQRYADLPGELHIIELEKDKNGLGLSLAGNKDRSRMSIFIVAINPDGPAGRDGMIRVGDELLEVNVVIITLLIGRPRCLLSAAPIVLRSRLLLYTTRNLPLGRQYHR